jgi:hypothetical protein
VRKLTFRARRPLFDTDAFETARPENEGWRAALGVSAAGEIAMGMSLATGALRPPLIKCLNYAFNHAASHSEHIKR